VVEELAPRSDFSGLRRDAPLLQVNGSMDVTDEHKRRISSWIDEGAKLSDIQRRLADEENLHLTYMEVRFLVDDLKLTPKDTAQSEVPVAVGAALASNAPAGNAPSASKIAPPGPTHPDTTGGKVSVTVDEITRAGALVSGNVVFSDGKKAGWYLDQLGRLGMVPEEQGYRPPPADVAEFQLALEKELARLGM
jgi:hypothetical protein